MKKAAADTTFDKIYAYYVNESPVHLSHKEDEIRRRWESADALLLLHYDRYKVIPILTKKFDISKAQANRDINNALRLFGDVNEVNEKGIRNLHYQMAMETWHLAKSCVPPDLDAMIKANGQMMKFKSLDKDISDIPIIQPHTYIIANDPKTLGFAPIENLDEVIAKFKKKKALESMDITDAEITG